MTKFSKIETGIKDLVAIEPSVFGDARGFFMETYHERDFQSLGILDKFVQDNHSKSKKNVFRGLHFQVKNPQGKLVRVVSGAALDITVDLRKDSGTFGNHFTILLTAENKTQLYVPEGFAHGFLTLEDNTEFVYKCTDYYSPKDESGIIWNDKELNIDYQLERFKINPSDVIVSEKDKKLQTFSDFVKSGVEIKR